jgi:hypothetical protein
VFSTVSARSTAATRPQLAFILAATAATLTASSQGLASESAFPLAAKSETANYLAEITAPGPFKVGAEGTATVTLTTKGVYHINAQYPYRFKAAAPPNGLTYPKPVLQRADGKFEEKRAVFKLSFVASQPGKFNVGGAFHLSVCSAENCLVDKPSLDVSVSVE